MTTGLTPLCQERVDANLPLTDARFSLLALGRAMVEKNIPLAVMLAKTALKGSRIPLEDRRQVAYYALVKAVAYYNAGYGYTFGTYATWCIRRELYQASNCDSLVTRSRNACRARDQKVVMAWKRAKNCGTLGSHFYGETQDSALTVNEPHPADRMRDERLDWIEAVLPQLPPREQAAVKRHITGQTLQELGKGFGISRERMRHIEVRGLDALRRLVAAKFGRAES